MARQRFKPNANFQLIVSEAVVGKPGERGAVVASSRGTTRRTRKTLEGIAEEIVQHAKDIVDSEVGLPSVTTGGGRNIGYDFRSVDRKGRTYRASFSTVVREQDGRLVIVVFNDHEHAQDVEYGSGPGGAIVEVRKISGYFELPITMRSYQKRKRFRKPRTEEQAKRNRQWADLSYQKKRLKELVASRRAKTRRISNLYNKGRGTVNGKPITNRQVEAIVDRKAVLDKQYQEAKKRREVARYNLKASRPKRVPRESFPAIAEEGRYAGTPVLYSRSFKTYKGYAILQRAIHNIGRHRF